MLKYCNNCEKPGHMYRQCLQPITSYGFILFNDNDKKEIKYLFINRKNSISYIEFLRGRYIININDENNPIINTKYATYLFTNMTKHERNLIETKTFDELWNDLWIYDNKKHKYEYINASLKYNLFKKGINLKYTTISLSSILAETFSVYDSPEWGFPKGRKNLKESDIDCAFRETLEETDLKRENIQLISDCPLTETYVGSNNTVFRCVYYIGKFVSNNPEDYKKMSLNVENISQKSEISDIKWFTLNEALNKIRPYYVAKKNVLKLTEQYIKNVYMNKDK